MPLTNTQLRYYDGNVLRLPDEKRKEYHGQLDRLIAELNRSVRDKTEIKITRVVKAGSFCSQPASIPATRALGSGTGLCTGMGKPRSALSHQ